MTFNRVLLCAAVGLVLAGCGTPSTPTTGASPSLAVSVRDPWVKTAASGMSATFGTLVNAGDTDVTVRAATSTASPVMELHEVVSADGQMVMRPKPGGFVIPAHGTHVLQPGADHLMMMEVRTPVRPGDQVAVTVTFTDGRTLLFTAVGKDFTGAKEDYQPSMPGMGGPTPTHGG